MKNQSTVSKQIKNRTQNKPNQIKNNTNQAQFEKGRNETQMEEHIEKQTKITKKNLITKKLAK